EEEAVSFAGQPEPLLGSRRVDHENALTAVFVDRNREQRRRGSHPHVLWAAVQRRLPERLADLPHAAGLPVPAAEQEEREALQTVRERQEREVSRLERLSRAALQRSQCP